MSSFEEYVDEAYLCMLTGKEGDDSNVFRVSDEAYAEELQLQEAIASSLISWIPQKPPKSESALDLSSAAAGPEELICGICMDPKETGETFQNGSCAHRFCRDCICNYIAVKIKEGSTIRCPESGCVANIDAHRCCGILPAVVFDRWSTMLAESLIHIENRFYCPYKDCSAPMEHDGEMVITMAECPHCRRLLCARCGVTWHADIGCDEFQQLGRNDISLMKLAEDKSWKRCPGCKFYVEKKDGCTHMTCRCSMQFCYSCGALWSKTHQC